MSAISFTKKNYTDTASSGSGLVAADMNKIEKAIVDLNTVVTSLQSSVSAYNVLWKDSPMFMHSNQTVMLSQTVDKQKHGIVLVWSEYSNGALLDSGYNYFFVPKAHVKYFNGRGVSMLMTNGGFFSHMTGKYCYIYNDKIKGNECNTAYGTKCGITYETRHLHCGVS